MSPSYGPWAGRIIGTSTGSVTGGVLNLCPEAEPDESSAGLRPVRGFPRDERADLNQESVPIPQTVATVPDWGVTQSVVDQSGMSRSWSRV